MLKSMVFKNQVKFCAALLIASLALPAAAQNLEQSSTDQAAALVRAAITVTPSVPSARTVQLTPSGYAVPRYVSLKYGAVNGRSGPSQNHPVAWRYSRRGLPVIIVAETDTWRKIRDQNGDESWMHKRTLDGRRSVIALQEVIMRTKPRDTASARAVAAKDTLFTMMECELGWCKVKSDTGHMGYVPQKLIWGASPL